MRVLFILRTEWGAIGTNASVMFPTLADQHDVEVCIFETHNNEQKKGNIVFPRSSLQIISATSNDISERADKLETIVKDFQPDIIHAFYHADLATVLKQSNISSDIPLIIDVRSPLTTNDQRLKWKLRLKNLWLEKRSHLIFALNKNVYRDLFPIGNVEKFKDVPTGVMFENKSVSALTRASKDHINFVYIGSIAKVRKLSLLIDGFLQFVEKTNAQNANLYIIGSGNQKSALQEHIQSHPHRQNIKILNSLQNHEISEFLSGMHVGITHVPKKTFNAAISLKSFEYAAANLPIMASESANMGQLEIIGYPIERYKLNIEDLSDKFSRLYNMNTLPIYPRPEKFIEYLQENDWRNIFQYNVLKHYRSLILKSHE